MKDKNLILNSEAKNSEVTPCFDDFYTVYGYTSKAGRKKMVRAACFADAFGLLRGNIKYRVKYKIKINYLQTPHGRNFCCLNEKYMKKHIKELHKFVNMKYRFTQYSEYYLLHIEITAYRLYHRLALAWIRYLYEFPFNIVLADYTLMSNHFKLEKLNMINIMLNSFEEETHAKSVHGICYRKDLITICDVPSLQGGNDISHECYYLSDLIDSYSLKDIRITHFKLFSLDETYKEMLADKEIQKRFEIYKENLKQIQEELKR